MDDRYEEGNYPQETSRYEWDAPKEHPNAYKLWLRMHFGF
jgi:hypothetical protein